MKNKILLLLLLIPSILFAQSIVPYQTDINDQLIRHKGYILSYNEVCEQPNWVSYQITKADLEKPKFKRKNDFRSDPSVPSESAHIKDYAKQGYDRGHLASAADFVYDKELLSETFYMSNMSPQLPGFNRGIWKKLESHVRKMAFRYDTIQVVTAGLLTGEMNSIGNNRVCIPTYYYKIVYSKKGGIVCYLLPHKKIKGSLDPYKVTIGYLEEISGLRFFID